MTGHAGRLLSLFVGIGATTAVIVVGLVVLVAAGLARLDRVLEPGPDGDPYDLDQMLADDEAEDDDVRPRP